ncbi:hypothetical protein B0H19DRAFT_1275084 [Mycena capillaripes]|nr:hypothetical protein B0H19DRAFT_1275084 [Mycena capillaripes]
MGTETTQQLQVVISRLSDLPSSSHAAILSILAPASPRVSRPPSFIPIVQLIRDAGGERSEHGGAQLAQDGTLRGGVRAFEADGFHLDEPPPRVLFTPPPSPPPPRFRSPLAPQLSGALKRRSRTRRVFSPRRRCPPPCPSSALDPLQWTLSTTYNIQYTIHTALYTLSLSPFDVVFVGYKPKQ